MSKQRIAPAKPSANSDSESSTVLWGTDIEHGDFIKLPRVLLKLRTYIDTKKFDLQPRHFFLLLVLASKRYKDHPIRQYWDELADDTGFKRNTLRKWAYELEGMKLLRLKRHRGRDPVNGKVGTRNERNEFFLDGFIELLTEAHPRHEKKKKARRKSAKESLNE